MFKKLKQRIELKQNSGNSVWNTALAIKNSVRRIKFLSHFPLYKMQKYLICEPIEGLNDALFIIKVAWDFAERYEKKLIIDTDHTFNIGEDFGKYFECKNRNPNVSFESSKDYLKNRFCSFVEVADVQPMNYILCRKEEPPTEHYALKTLTRLTLTPNFAKSIQLRLQNLPQSYVAVHVRNTDLMTDYKTLFKNIYDDLADKNVLICSDDHDCIEYAKKYFEKSNIYTISDIPRLHGEPLHKTNKISRYHINLNTFTDLFGLACSDKIYYTESYMPNKERRISHFVLLALELQNNKHIIDQLLRKTLIDRTFIKPS